MHDTDTMPAYDTGGTMPTIEYLPATAPAYARTLEERALRAEAALAALNDSLGSLRAYCRATKFTPTDGAATATSTWPMSGCASTKPTALQCTLTRTPATRTIARRCSWSVAESFC